MKEKNVSANKDLVEFMKQQIVIEKEIVESLNKSLVDIENPPVKGVLKGISLDSVKHAELYASAVSLLTNVSTALKQENLDEQRALVEKHIQMEAELIKKMEKIMPVSWPTWQVGKDPITEF